MNKRNYRVCMHTPMGTKYGNMLLLTEDGAISGSFEILRKKHPITGTVGEDGNCELTGSLVTLMNIFKYQATGNITEDKILLTLNCGKHKFKLEGVALGDGKEKVD